MNRTTASSSATGSPREPITLRRAVAWNLIHALLLAAFVPGFARAEEAAPAPAPAAEAAPAEAPAPAVPAADIDALLEQLLSLDPAALQGRFDSMKGETDALAAEAAALEAKLGEIRARIDESHRRLSLVERLMGVFAPAAAAPPAATAEAEAKAAEEKAMAEAAAKKAEEEKAMADAKAAEEKKMAEMKAAEEEKKKAEMALAANPGEAPKINYDEHVLPIFMAKCASCHNQDKARGGFALESFDKIMAGGSSGQVIAPGDAQGSRLFRLLTHEEEPKMPQGAAKLDDASLDIVRKWIDGGALKDKKSKAKMAPKADTSLAAGAAPEIVIEGELPIPRKQENIAAAPLEGALAIRAIAGSPVAPVVAVGGQRQILMYQAETFELLAAFDFPEGLAETIRFSPNGSLLVVAGGEAGKIGLAAIYDVITGERLGEFGRTFDTILCADISLDHTQVVVGGSDKRAKVFNTGTGELQYQIEKHTDWVQSVAFSPDGWFLATADRSGGLFVWQAETGRDVHELRGHTGAINAADFRSDSNVLATAGLDGQIYLWEMGDGKNIKKWGAHGEGVLSMRFAKDGRVVSSGVDRVTAVWDGEGKQLAKFPPLEDWAYAACFAKEDQRVFAGSWKGTVRAFEIASSAEVGAITLAPAPPAPAPAPAQ